MIIKAFSLIKFIDFSFNQVLEGATTKSMSNVRWGRGANEASVSLRGVSPVDGAGDREYEYEG